MGLFDIFKKKSEKQVTSKNGETKVSSPLKLEHRDKSIDEVSFLGLCDVEGKSLHKVRVIRYLENGDIMGKDEYFLDPILANDEQGRTFDNTESYYKSINDSIDRSTQEGRRKFANLKGFFDRDVISEYCKTNYIGILTEHTNNEGKKEFIRAYADKGFKAKYEREYDKYNSMLKTIRSQTYSPDEVRYKTKNSDTKETRNIDFQNR